MSDSLTLVTVSGKSRLEFGRSERLLSPALAGRRAIILTDSTLAALYPALLSNYPTLVYPPGESIKTLPRVESICQRLLDDGFDRSAVLVAVGGGTVCDLAGFVASIYMRGIACCFVPTTLLAQLDAAIGGKNAVNLGSVKNALGTIRQAESVLIDNAFNASLPELEIWSGLGELVKYAWIAGGAMLDDVHTFVLAYRSADSQKRKTLVSGQAMTALVRAAVAIKLQIVAEDENDQGRRQVLNLGHTLGHAIELLEELPHGLAVLKGLRFALKFSEHKGFIDADSARRLDTLLTATGQDLTVSAGRRELTALLARDKKKHGADLSFIVVQGPGRVQPCRIAQAELAAFLGDYLS